jgi:hypothetical protein
VYLFRELEIRRRMDRGPERPKVITDGPDRSPKFSIGGISRQPGSRNGL